MDRRRLFLCSLISILAGAVLIGSAAASGTKTDAGSGAATQSVDTGKPSSEKTSSKKPATANSKANPSEIASAKSKGLVWVNTESRVYHTGGRYYGNTKHGQFMSVADAQRAGYKAAKR